MASTKPNTKRTTTISTTATNPPKPSEESDEDGPENGDEDRFSIGKGENYDDWVEEYLKKTNISGNMLRHCRCGIDFCPWCGK